MKFKKYPSLTNAHMIKSITEFRELVPSNKKWYVTEKVHGANFQISGEIVDGEIDIKLGSRNNYTDLSFFGLARSEEFMVSLNKASSLLKDLLCCGDNKTVRIYGEVYGGNIQKGIFYSNAKRFRAFDIMVGNTLLSRNECLELFESVGLDYCTTIFQGSLDECLAHSNDFDSLINSEINGDDATEGNICEGVVIRPVRNYRLSSGALVAIKNKNDKWLEKSRVPKRDKQNTKLSDIDMEIYQSVYSYINHITIISAVSKIGRELKFIPIILKEVVSDIVGEVLKDESNYYEEKDVVRITKLCSNRIVKIIKSDILNEEYIK